MSTHDHSQDDTELLRRFRHGDEAAFRELLERYGELVSRRVSRKLPRSLRRRLTIQDVLQDACLAAYQSRERFVGDDARLFRNWLLGIVDNKVKQAVRHHAGTARRALGREKTRTQRPATAAARAIQPTPSAMAVEREQVDRVRQALEKLPEDYREILRLTREEHLTVRESAERMGRSHDAAKKLYARALARVRSLVHQKPEHNDGG